MASHAAAASARNGDRKMWLRIKERKAFIQSIENMIFYWLADHRSLTIEPLPGSRILPPGPQQAISRLPRKCPCVAGRPGNSCRVRYNLPGKICLPGKMFPVLARRRMGISSGISSPHGANLS